MKRFTTLLALYAVVLAATPVTAQSTQYVNLMLRSLRAMPPTADKWYSANTLTAAQIEECFNTGAQLEASAKTVTARKAQYEAEHAALEKFKEDFQTPRTAANPRSEAEQQALRQQAENYDTRIPALNVLRKAVQSESDHHDSQVRNYLMGCVDQPLYTDDLQAVKRKLN